MPSASTTVTATYKDAGTTKYTLTVTNGSGDGSYLAGTKITITADPAPAGKVFDKWTGTTSCVSSITSATTTVTMPAASTTVIAAYKTVSTTKYTLTVTNGTGDGSYVAGTQTTITADPAPAGKMFDKWIGCDSCLASITSATTKATMTASNLTLTATYKDIVASELPDGTLIKLPDSPKVYIIENGEKKWIPTPEVFEQMGGDWNEIITATQSILDAIADLEDNLIRMIDDFKVFLVTDGVKRHIPNPEVFLDYGFDWGDVKEVNEETVTQYEDTYLIRETGTEPVYYLNPEGVRKWIPTEEIFNSYQDKWEDVQIVSKTEMESYPVSNLIREEGSNDIYLTENNIKKYIPSPTVFNKYGLDWNSVTTVNQTEFNWYKSGGELR